jgi:hypothetical protein
MNVVRQPQGYLMQYLQIFTDETTDEGKTEGVTSPENTDE